MPLKRENRRRQITLNVSPYVYDVDAVALSLINQFKADEAAPEITKLDEYKLSLTFRETDELTYEVACQKILWNQYVQNIEQKNVTNNIELLKKLVDPYFDSPVVANVNEVIGDGKGQLDGISPSAFSDGEMLWADGKPMPHPEYNIDLGIRPEGPPLLTKDINKAVQPSTITAAIDKDTFFCADGVMKVGDEFHPILEDFREDTPGNKHYPNGGRMRGGEIQLPNRHSVSIAWGTANHAENYRKHKIEDFNETPRTAEVAVINPEGKLIHLDNLDGEEYEYGYQTTEQAKELIRRAKEL